MRVMMMAAAMSLGLAGVAAADPMVGVYGNTVKVTYPNGAASQMYIDADGAYAAKAPDGAMAKGTWKVEGGQTCFTQVDPAPPADMVPNCSPTVERKAGDSWDVPGPNGMVLKVSIEAGR